MTIRSEIEKRKQEQITKKTEIRLELETKFWKHLEAAKKLKETPEFAHEDITDLATSLSMQAAEIPPHFSHWVTCKKCGIMPTFVHNGPDLMPVIACPWCSVTSYDFTAKAVKTLREIKNHALTKI